MTAQAPGPDLRRHLAEVEGRLDILERRLSLRPTAQRPPGPFVRSAGDTMTGALTMSGDAYINASRGLRVGEIYGQAGLYRSSGELWHAANGHVWRKADNTWLGDLSASGNLTVLGNMSASGDIHMGQVFAGAGLRRSVAGSPMSLSADGFNWVTQGNVGLASLDTGGNFFATGFKVGNDNEQRIEIHRHEAAAYIHFYAPGESFHGNLYQRTSGIANATRRAEILMYPSAYSGQNRPDLFMRGKSDDGTIKPMIWLDAYDGVNRLSGASVEIVALRADNGFHVDAGVWMHDGTRDVGLQVGSAESNVRVLNNAANAFRPILASAFTVSSDPDIKEDIRPAPPNMTEALRAINVIRYKMRQDWDDGSGADHIGVESTSLPVIVQRPMTTDDGTITGYDVSAALAWLCGVAKEMDQRLTAMEARR